VGDRTGTLYPRAKAAFPTRSDNPHLWLLGRDILHHRARLTKAAASTAGASCTRCRARVPLVVLMNNRRPCTRSGCSRVAHVKTSYFRPARSPARSRCSGGHESLACISCSKSLKTWTASPPDARTVAIVVVARGTSTAIAQSGTVSVGVSSVINEELHAPYTCIFKSTTSDIISALQRRVEGLMLVI